MHQMQTQYRTSDIPGFVKQGKSRQLVRSFKKATSVFKDWKEDDDKKIEQCLDHDFPLWKVPRFVKDAD